MDEQIPPLTQFVLPGGNKEISFAHVARTVCRRAERRVITLSKMSEVESLIIEYLNRLSDYIFVLSRDMARKLEAKENFWNPRIKK